MALNGLHVNTNASCKKCKKNNTNNPVKCDECNNIFHSSCARRCGKYVNDIFTCCGTREENLNPNLEEAAPFFEATDTASSNDTYVDILNCKIEPQVLQMIIC